MAPFRRAVLPATLFAALLMTSHDASAITAKDVMEKMVEKERFGYVTGLIDMLSYQAQLAGDQKRAKCIVDAFYGKKDQTWRTLFEVFGKYPDKAPEGLVVVLMNRTCG